MDWVNALQKVNNKFKFQLFGRTFENLLHFYAILPKYDPQHTGGLSPQAANLLFNAGGVFLSTQEISVIQHNFAHPLGLDYLLFLANVRNDLTQKRLAAIDHTFAQFDREGRAALSDLLASIAIDRHPHVRSMSKQGVQARLAVESGLRYWSKDGVTLSYEEFSEYCKDVNATVPLEREEFFLDILVHTFGLFEQGVSFDRIRELEVTIFEKVRQKTDIKQDEGRKSSSVFRFLDLEGKGALDFLGFVGVLDRVGCKFSDRECKAIFYKHSRGGTALDYEGLCAIFFHMGSGTKDNSNSVFEMSSSSGQGAITTHGMTKRLH